MTPTQPISSSTQPVNNNSVPPQKNQNGGWGILNPLNYVAEKVGKGLTEGSGGVLSQNQADITQKFQQIGKDALLQEKPKKYQQLLESIQRFLQSNSQEDLTIVRNLAKQMNAEEIKNIDPWLPIQDLTSLTMFDGFVEEGASELKIKEELQKAEKILPRLIQKLPEGVLPLFHKSFQHQLNHPNEGIIPQSLNIFRKKLNSRLCEPLRECWNAMQAYRNALIYNANIKELNPLLNSLHSKLLLLIHQKDLVPEFTEPQWKTLKNFTDHIEKVLAYPYSQIQDGLRQQAAEPFKILKFGVDEQYGMAEEMKDILVDGIRQGVDQFVTLPRRMINDVTNSSPFAPTSASRDQPSSSQAQSAPAPSFFDLGTLVAQGGKLLNSLLSTAGNASSRLAARNLSTLVLFAFQKINEHVQHNDEHAHLIKTLNPMIKKIESAQEKSSWGELFSALEDAFNFMQKQQVYLQTLRLPLNPVRSHSSVIPDLLQDINAHDDVLQPLRQRAPKKISEKDIEQQATVLKSRLAAYGPTKFVVEQLCGFNWDDAGYAEIFKVDDPSQNDFDSLFRDRLFDKIDQSNLNFLTKWIAKRTFDILIPISTFYTHSFTDSILSSIREWSQKTDPQVKEEMFIKVMRNWLAVTSGAYNSVAYIPPTHVRDIEPMLEEAIKIPERNGGLTQAELFSAAAKTALDTFGPRIRWYESIDKYFTNEIPATSVLHFLNPLVKVLNGFCSFCLKAIVFIPQWIGNQTLQGVAKLLLNNTTFLKDYTDQKIEELRHNTPNSYAMQQLIFRQLQKTLAFLQESLKADPDSPDYPLNRDANITRIEITGLVKYLIEVLNKSQYHTQDDLREFLQKQTSARDRIGREIDNAFLPEIMETAVMNISIVMKGLIEGEKQIIYDILGFINGTFETSAPVTRQQSLGMDRAIQELLDQTLETSIYHALGDVFDFTNEKQKKGISNFITSLKEQTQTVVSQVRKGTQEILQGKLTPTATYNSICEMIEQSKYYYRERLDALGKAEGNRNFHTETKQHLNEMTKDLRKYSNPVSERLNAMKLQFDEMRNNIVNLKILVSSQTALTKIGAKAQKPRDLSECKAQLITLKAHLEDLRRNRCPVAFDEMELRCKEISAALNELEKLQGTEDALRNIQSFFQELKNEKLACIGKAPSAALQSQERKVSRAIFSLPSLLQKQQLQEVHHLMLAQTRESVQVAAQKFYQVHTQINALNSSAIKQQNAALMQSIQVFSQTLGQHMSHFYELQLKNKAEINRNAQEVSSKLDLLEKWSQAVEKLDIWNLFIFDMTWITEWIKTLAFDRAKAKTQQLLDSLYQRHSYIGLINQVGILPFLEKFGKHHLKTQQ